MSNLPRVTVVTGNGKGKTTAGMGRAVLAAWSGDRVLVIQFLKGTGYTGELRAIDPWQGRLNIRQFGAGCARSVQIAAGMAECIRCGDCFRGNRNPKYQYADQAFRYARDAVDSSEWDLLVLDEISHSLNKGLLNKAQVMAWLHDASQKVRLVLTGRNMPAELIEMADEATECEAVKHPMLKGICGRRGIEY